jgi:hypothetical protein
MIFAFNVKELVSVAIVLSTCCPFPPSFNQALTRMECVDFAVAHGAKENEMNLSSFRSSCYNLELTQKLQKVDLELAQLSMMGKTQ